MTLRHRLCPPAGPSPPTGLLRTSHLARAFPHNLPGPQSTFLGRLDNPSREYTARFNELPRLVCPTPQEDADARAAVHRVAELLRQELPKACRVSAIVCDRETCRWSLHANATCLEVWGSLAWRGPEGCCYEWPCVRACMRMRLVCWPVKRNYKSRAVRVVYRSSQMRRRRMSGMSLL